MDAPKFVSGLLSFVTSLIMALLGLRIVMKLLGASMSAEFVRWLYLTTDPLLNPFQGIFPSPSTSTGIVIEFSSIFALAVYAFLGYLAANAVDFFSIEPRNKTKEK